MRYLLCATTLFLTALPLHAADRDRPNTLTPKEIADGWILLFDGDSTFGWTSPNDSKWTISQGMLAPQAGKPGLLVTTTAFSDYELKLDYRVRSDTEARVHFRCNGEGKVDVPSDKTELRHHGDLWMRMTVRITGNDIPHPSYESLSNGLFGSFASSSFAADSKIEPKPTSGRIALSGNGVIFRNIQIRPLNLQPISTGKNLAGWKEFPGRKSKFTVTPEGWLNIKDGPGDLQTEGQWADFVLQLECRSNGQHLNSGVFFRCIPDQYQQGYEAQIRNQFTPEATQEYTVEEYDPQTGELKDKKKVKSPAIDYGTGAIYRRQPARRQASKDGEWFTMTVVANGRHIATWVNGIQVTDWTDNRPINMNARQGCRLDKGPISLQGHDPTTDLSFRNFRIAELPGGDKQP
jgi:hypothetical protein